jgi:predicted Rossmann-fold nucleotide-binding protein
VLVLDPVGLYQPLQTWLNQLTELGFISAESAQCVYWTKDIETALDQITQELVNPVTRQGTDAEIVEAEI